jgi:hypothetical protein
MADVVQVMYRDVIVVFRTDSQALIEDVEKRDDQVDFLEREIKLFLARVGREAMGTDLTSKEIGLISFIGNLENVGDIIDKNLMELARNRPGDPRSAAAHAATRAGAARVASEPSALGLGRVSGDLGDSPRRADESQAHQLARVCPHVSHSGRDVRTGRILGGPHEEDRGHHQAVQTR